MSRLVLLLLVVAVGSAAAIPLRDEELKRAALGLTAEDGSLLEADASGTPDLKNSPCNDCKKFVTAITTVTARLALNTNQVILRAQTLAQQMDVCSSLNLECHVYAEVKRWLERATIMDDLSPPAQKLIMEHPEQACHSVNLCGRVNLTALTASHSARGRPDQPVMVRVKLVDSLSKLDRKSDSWRLFVKTFLHAIADFLKIPADRLSLHMHQTDELAEIVIKAPATPSATDKRTPTQLGQILKANLGSGSTALTLPTSIGNSVVHTFQAQVLPLVVPVTLPTNIPSPVSNLSNSTLPPCSVLETKSRQACGETFHCSADCRTAFAQYHGKCLSHTLDRDQHIRVGNQYKEFFDMCDKCTAKRLAEVTKRCGFASTKDISMPNSCSLYCSEAFMPYYKDCLEPQSESWGEQQRTTMEGFYTRCGKCTHHREAAVTAICDTRVGPQAYNYPGTCTMNCSQVFPAYYDGCLDGALGGVKEGAGLFRSRCQTAVDGGVFFRFYLKQSIASIVHTTDYKENLIKELGKLLHFTDLSRVEVTGFTGEPGKKLPLGPGEYQGGITRSPDRIQVDLVMKIGKKIMDPDPASLVDMFRILVSKPDSNVYKFPICQYIDSYEGVQLLVPGTHDVAKQTGPSSLQLAIAEYQKGVENHAPPDVINYLQAIVTYHTAVKMGAPSTRTNADLARVAYYATIAHNASPDTIAYYKARYTVALDLDQKAAVASLSRDKALMEYLGAVAKGDTQKVIDAKHGILEWREAELKNPKDLKTLGYLHAVMIQLMDISRNASPETINFDKANVQMEQDIKTGVTAEKLDLDKATVEYLNQLRLGANVNFVNAAKALMEYRQAVLDHKSALVQADKKASLAYYEAVKEQKKEEVLKSLSAIMVEAHRKAVAEGTAKRL